MESQGDAAQKTTSFSLVATADGDMVVPGQPSYNFGAGYKTCVKCGAEKPLVEFHVDKKSADGRKTFCKSCKSSYDKKRNSPVVDRQVALENAYYRAIKDGII